MKINLENKKRKIWFMSDLHYGHKNILLHCPLTRPFDDIKEMNDQILSELSSKISSEDIVFDLGDLAWKPNDEILNTITNSIKSKMIFKIIGNHDSEFFYTSSNKFKLVKDIVEITIRDKGVPYRLILSHYPMMTWNHKFRGSLHLHGHCHGNLDNVNIHSTDLRVDVGYDGILAKSVGSFLISFEDILNYFYKKTNNTSFKDYTENNCLIL